MRVTPEALGAIVEHAKKDAPNECCGLVVGSGNLIEEAVPARNLHASTTRYLIDPEDHFALIRRLRGTPRRVVGAYHSHPASPAIPSESDVGVAHYPDFVWLIVSLENPDEPAVRAFRIHSGQSEEIALEPWNPRT